MNTVPNNEPVESVSASLPEVDMKWSIQEERLLTLWSDRALCYRLLHEESHKRQSKKLMWFTIPVIILSTLTGTANFGIQSLVSDENRNLAQSCIGILNIFAGIITTIQNFLRISELSESHRQAFIGWGQLNRNIFTELQLDRKKRKPCKEMLQRFRAEYDRLIAISPLLSKQVISDLMIKFKHHEDLLLPEECDHLIHTEPVIDQLIRDQCIRNSNGSTVLSDFTESEVDGGTVDRAIGDTTASSSSIEIIDSPIEIVSPSIDALIPTEPRRLTKHNRLQQYAASASSSSSSSSVVSPPSSPPASIDV